MPPRRLLPVALLAALVALGLAIVLLREPPGEAAPVARDQLGPSTGAPSPRLRGRDGHSTPVGRRARARGEDADRTVVEAVPTGLDAREAHAPPAKRPVWGPGFVSGRVTFPDGSAADHVGVRATLADDRAAPLPGLSRRETRTDAEGRFRISRLKAARYVIEAPASVRGQASLEVPPCTSDAHLVVRLHRTCVRLRDPAGRPVRGADLGMMEHSEGRRPMSRRPVPPDGVTTLWYEPGSHFVVAGHLDDHAVAEAEVLVPERPWSRDVVLVLAPHHGKRGRLRIELKDEAGVSISKYGVVLTSPLAGSRLTRGGTLRPDAAGVVRDVPPGRHLLNVYADEDTEEDWIFHVEREIVVRADAETRLVLRCHRGGRVRVRERLEATHVAREDVDARMRFERPGERLAWSLFLNPDYPDQTWLLEPGPWTMVVYGEGIHEQRRTVVVRAGETTIEDVVLHPE